jgi:ABC-type antimicrobial peptide transport system permease subunit
VLFQATFETLDYGTYTHAVIHSKLSAAELQQALAELTRDGALDVEIDSVRPLGMIRSEITAPDRVRGSFTIAAAALVVLLSALGFYSTQRYLVSAGRREYAIRASIGAGPSALGHLVLRRSILLGLPGLILGGFSSFIVVAWLRSDFIAQEISPLIVTAGVLVGLTVLLNAASLSPAREARRTRPASLLRED